MRYIPCTIETLSAPGENCWIISVPADVVKNAAALFAELLADDRKQIVFLDRKTELTITRNSAACNEKRICITSDFLECIQNLFSQNVRPGISHIDYDFPGKHGDFGITVFIK